MNKASKLVSISVATALGAVLLSGTDAVSADTVPNSSPTQYVIKSGDTLNAIAKDYATTAQDIADGNGIKDINVIFAGDTITINGQAPAKDTAPVAPSAPVQDPAVPVAPVQAPVAPATPVAPVAPKVAPVAPQAPSTGSAKEEIARRESGGSYTARNGKYVGRYQLTDSYLHGDYSQANQERVADAYVASRYGSWEGALSFWNANGWY